MKKISSAYLDFKDTLECGQVFRFKEKDGGYLVYSLDKCAFVKNEGDYALIDGDEYFENYFDLNGDYRKITEKMRSFGIEKLSAAVDRHKGLRILKQDAYEATASFIVSQNNNIPRIKKIIENLCAALGEKRRFAGEEYYSFPTAEAIANAPTDLLKGLGLGYRDVFIKGFAEKVCSGEIEMEALKSLDTVSLREKLVSVKGIGNKVADCAVLFGFNRFDSFPVDTWIEKLYFQDFKGELNDRKKISKYFVDMFGEFSGYAQQYLFFAKRESEF